MSNALEIQQLEQHVEIEVVMIKKQPQMMLIVLHSWMIVYLMEKVVYINQLVVLYLKELMQHVKISRQLIKLNGVGVYLLHKVFVLKEHALIYKVYQILNVRHTTMTIVIVSQMVQVVFTDQKHVHNSEEMMILVLNSQLLMDHAK